MFCIKCGKQNDDGAVFCKFCGTPTSNNNSNAQYVNTPQMPAQIAPKKSVSKPMIIAISSVVAALVLGLSIGIPLSMKSKSNGNYSQLGANTNGIINNNTGGNTNNNNGNGGFGGNSANTNTTANTQFVVGRQSFSLNKAAYGRDGSTTAIMFEGSADIYNVAIFAIGAEGFANSATYYQRDFGETIEIFLAVYIPSTGEFLYGSSATGGIQNAVIKTGDNTEAYVSGTLISGSDSAEFSIGSAVNYEQFENIRSKLISYVELISDNSNNGAGGIGGTGQNQPMRCTGCSSRGVGLCQFCNGDATCHICVDGMSRCQSCGGSRICQWCGGTGICHYCGGDGIMYN